MAASSNLSFRNRLLVVDDEPSICRSISRVAESVGFEVFATEDPSVFLRAAQQWQPTVIILDLNIPGTDGIQLLRALAADKCSARVALSSGADSKVLQAAQQLGLQRGLNMASFIRKPFRLETLRSFLLEFRPVPKNLLAVDLANAISSGQLFLEYQPKLDCHLGRITGVEALVRWHHPVHGVVRPDQFIALAEETDLIHSLTNWVLAEATRQAAIWEAEGLGLAVAANISAKDIIDLDLPERLHQHCQNAGVDPASIIVELTETGAMREAVQMMDVLTRLRLKGFRLAIDDFGTGYSSLVQLQKMPFSEVKIDASFVMKMITNADCRVIVEIISLLAIKLGLKSVAEGVEDEAALRSLIEMGCDMAQGYLLSRPVPADQIANFVHAHNANALSALSMVRQAAL